MEIPTHLTIQDYFEHRIRVSSQLKRCSRAAMAAEPASGDDSFSRTLDRARKDTAGTVRGLTIRDYLKTRISSQSSTVAAKASCAALPRPPIVPSQPATMEKQESVPKTKPAEKAPRPGKGALKGDPLEVRRKISASIERAAARFGVPAALIKAVVKAESNYQVQALSPAGAQGLMQLMPATAKELGVTDPFDIEQNIRGGAQYLRNMLDQFDGDLRLALSAYNAGPGAVAKYAGNVPYAETRNYVQRVLRYTEAFSSPEVT